ncbi:alpha/beta hydrolase [Streptosporangiaceae bacterium NEAU-GS5]|nr:alpha/beta hydrolase [Streptosporangiaceae bacterium NEAU-GS5]
MAFAIANGVRLFYTDDGNGDAMLLVHGWGSDSHEWSPHIPVLARDRRVIAVDLRGHGYSAAYETGNTPRQMAGDLAVLVAGLGIGSCVVIGHSMGGQIASILAVEHPDLVTALVAVDPGYGFPAAVAEASLKMFRGRDPNEAAVDIDQWCYTAASPAWLREWHRRRLLATAPHVLAEAFAALWDGPEAIGVRPASDDYLSRRACPVLTFGSDPRRTGWESGLFKDPRSAAVTWPGSGHRLHEERPAEFLLVVNDWLRSLT